MGHENVSEPDSSHYVIRLLSYGIVGVNLFIYLFISKYVSLTEVPLCFFTWEARKTAKIRKRLIQTSDTFDKKTGRNKTKQCRFSNKGTELSTYEYCALA
jgi:hypothetical protein